MIRSIAVSDQGLTGIYMKFTVKGKSIMADRMQYPETDPRHHTLKIKSMRGDVVDPRA
jgi:hypothetical protein